MTSVGATTGISPETATDFSGGGFSVYFEQPAYQANAVGAFLKGHTTYQGLGLINASGRGYPDVSLQGSNYETVWYQQNIEVTSTIASTTTFASIISLLNEQLLTAGKPVLGFLNPWLYSTAASAFTDITSGHADGCDTPGFFAVAGWDPVCAEILAAVRCHLIVDADHWSGHSYIRRFIEGCWSVRTGNRVGSSIHLLRTCNGGRESEATLRWTQS